LEKANIISTKIGKLISEHRSSILSKVDCRPNKELWAIIKLTLKAGSCKRSLSARFDDKCADLDAINEYLLILLLIHAMTLVSLRNLLILYQFRVSLEEFCSIHMDFLKCCRKLRKKLLLELTNYLIGYFVNVLAV
jgi:hypothetical protein